MASIISLQEARRIVLAQDLQPTDPVRVDLLASLGRRMAESVSAAEAWPTTDRSAMDGFALARGAASYAIGTKYSVVGESLAGHPYDGALDPGTAIRIMTGAVVPEGADRVVKVEETNGFEVSELEISAEVVSGANIRPQGSEVAAGTLLISAGTLIRSAEIGALAVLGIDSLSVHRRPRVAIISTGDEVVSIDRTPHPHQLRDSNSYALAAKVCECGGEPIRIGIIEDSEEALRNAFAASMADADVVLTIGGVSKGSHDLVHPTLAAMGVEERFHGIALKPGKPALFGVRDFDEHRCFVFGLPGNPASCVTVFDLLVRPLITKLLGGSAELSRLGVRLNGAGLRKNWRVQALPCRLRDVPGQGLEASLCAASPSGNPFGMLTADGYALAPADTDPEAMDRVEFEAFAPSDWGVQG